MKKLSRQEFQEVRHWIYRNARPLDLARWQYHFENGSRDSILAALEAYRKDDGGFGLGLEADNWNPNSNPFTTGVAIDVLEEIGLLDNSHPIVRGILDYLASGKDSVGGIWPFAIPSNNDHPHAPWWTYSEATNADYGYFTTAVLAGFILRAADRSTELYRKALALGDAMIEKLKNVARLDAHELQGFCHFAGDVEKAGLADRFDGAFFAGRLKELVDEAIERDPLKWPVYSMRPTMYILSPSSAFYPGNEDVAGKEMDYILSSRKAGGVWEISWSWDGYPDEFAVAANWWRGNWAIRNVLMLKEFGRLE